MSIPEARAALRAAVERGGVAVAGRVEDGIDGTRRIVTNQQLRRRRPRCGASRRANRQSFSISRRVTSRSLPSRRAQQAHRLGAGGDAGVAETGFDQSAEAALVVGVAGQGAGLAMGSRRAAQGVVAGEIAGLEHDDAVRHVVEQTRDNAGARALPAPRTRTMRRPPNSDGARASSPRRPGVGGQDRRRRAIYAPSDRAAMPAKRAISASAISRTRPASVP